MPKKLSPRQVMKRLLGFQCNKCDNGIYYNSAKELMAHEATHMFTYGSYYGSATSYSVGTASTYFSGLRSTYSHKGP